MEESKTATIISFSQRLGELNDARESETKASAPTPPNWLTPLARKHWDEIAPALGRHEITNDLDADMLAVYCSTFARFIELDIKLDEVGMTQKTATGYEAETGTFTAWNKLLKPIMAYAKQLGLTPPARVSMRLDQGKKDLLGDF